MKMLFYCPNRMLFDYGATCLQRAVWRLQIHSKVLMFVACFDIQYNETRQCISEAQNFCLNSIETENLRKRKVSPVGDCYVCSPSCKYTSLQTRIATASKALSAANSKQFPAHDCLVQRLCAVCAMCMCIKATQRCNVNEVMWIEIRNRQTGIKTRFVSSQKTNACILSVLKNFWCNIITFCG